jgi:hypothetical protein
MSQWVPTRSTHTAIIPGRRRDNRFTRGLLIGLAISAPILGFLALAGWGAWTLFKDILDVV